MRMCTGTARPPAKSFPSEIANWKEALKPPSNTSNSAHRSNTALSLSTSTDLNNLVTWKCAQTVYTLNRGPCELRPKLNSLLSHRPYPPSFKQYCLSFSSYPVGGIILPFRDRCCGDKYTTDAHLYRNGTTRLESCVVWQPQAWTRARTSHGLPLQLTLEPPLPCYTLWTLRCLGENIVFCYVEDRASKAGGSSSARDRAGPTTLHQPGVFGTFRVLSMTQLSPKANQGQGQNNNLNILVGYKFSSVSCPGCPSLVGLQKVFYMLNELDQEPKFRGF